MGAAEIKQWLEEHGGQALDPTTDANGVTVYVAGDGSYIAVTRDGTVRLRGFSPPSANGASTGPQVGSPVDSLGAAPPATTTGDATSGADGADATPASGPLTTYTQDQVNARLAEIGQQIGAPPRYVPQQRTRRVVNPAAVISDPRFVPGSPSYIDQPYTVESWYDPRNNTLLFQGQRQADGTFQTTTDAAPRTPQLTAAQTAALVPTTPGIEGTPIPGQRNADGSQAYDNTKPILVRRDANHQQVGPAEPLTAGQREQWEREKNGGLTDAELRARQTPASKRDPVKGHPGISIVTTADPNNPNAVSTHYENDQGQIVPTPIDQPTPEKAPDGSYGYWDTSSSPPKWVTVTGPSALQTPVQINGTYGVWKPDPSGGPPTFEPIKQQPGLEATPADAPNVDLSNPQRAYDSFMQLYQWASSKVARGEKTPQWLESVLQGPHTAVSTVLDREKELQRRTEQQQANQLTQRSQDVSLSGNRLSNATSGFSTAQDAAQKMNLLAGPGNNAYSSTLLGTLALQRLNAQAMGGLADIAPVIPGPLAQPGTPPPGIPGAATPSAAAAQAEADRQRSAAQAGASLAPVAAGVTATNAAAINPSGANVQAANDATMAGSNAAFGGLGIGVPPTSGPGQVPTSPPDPNLAPPTPPPTSFVPPGSPSGVGGPDVIPTMALAGSLLGQNPYAYALEALRRHGIGEDSIMAAHQDFING